MIEVEISKINGSVKPAHWGWCMCWSSKMGQFRSTVWMVESARRWTRRKFCWWELPYVFQMHLSTSMFGSAKCKTWKWILQRQQKYRFRHHFNTVHQHHNDDVRHTLGLSKRLTSLSRMRFKQPTTRYCSMRRLSFLWSNGLIILGVIIMFGVRLN